MIADRLPLPTTEDIMPFQAPSGLVDVLPRQSPSSGGSAGSWLSFDFCCVCMCAGTMCETLISRAWEDNVMSVYLKSAEQCIGFILPVSSFPLVRSFFLMFLPFISRQA